MTLSTTQPLANRHDVARTIFRYGPSTAALIYPLLLVSLHQSGRHFVQATDATGKLLAGLAVGLSAALVYSVPLLSFAAISQSAGQIRTRQFAHLAFAAPPLFVMIGVFFYMLNVPNGDYAFWAIAWLGVIGFAAFVSPTNAGRGTKMAQDRSRIFRRRDYCDLLGVAPRQSRDRRLEPRNK